MSYGDPEEVRSLARSRTAGTGSTMGIDRGVANTIATSEGSYDRDLPSLGVVVRHTLECLRCLLDEARELGCVGLPGALRCISMSESGEHVLEGRRLQPAHVQRDEPHRYSWHRARAVGAYRADLQGNLYRSL